MKKLLSLSLLLLFFGCSNHQTELENLKQEESWNLKISQFSNCEEVVDYNQRFQTHQYLAYSSSESQAEHYQPQVEGVQEGDLLQSTPHHYFFARSSSLEIVNRNNLTLVKSIPIIKKRYHQLFYSDKKLVSISSDSESSWIRIFDEENHFSLLSEKKYAGTILDFRYFQGSLILVTNQPSVQDIHSLDCSRIYRPLLQDGSLDLTNVYKIPIQDRDKPVEILQLMGEGNFFYMTQKELFLFHSSSDKTATGFQVIDWGAGSLDFQQSQKFDGFLKDRTAVHQKDSDLILASTFYENSTSDNPAILIAKFSNRLISFRKDAQNFYQFLSASPSFGRHEDIRAVQFIKDKAYVVTFEKTDPLFVIDIIDPGQMTILSELHSPGFSTQLVPAEKDQLLGVGYDTISAENFSWFAGIKFSLFHIGNSFAPTETSVLKYGDRGSFTEASFTNKGLFVSADHEKIFLPVVLLQKETEAPAWEIGRKHLFSGLLVLRKQGDKMQEERRITHQVWRDKHCGPNAFHTLFWWSSRQDSLDIQRSLQNKDCIDSFSRFGVTRHCSNDDQPTESVEFNNDKTLCE